MFSEAAKHINKASKHQRKILSELAVMKFVWMTLYILKNSQLSEIRNIVNPTKK